MIYSQPRVLHYYRTFRPRSFVRSGAIMYIICIYVLYVYVYLQLSQKLFHDESRQLHDYKMVGIAV